MPEGTPDRNSKSPNQDVPSLAQDPESKKSSPMQGNRVEADESEEYYDEEEVPYVPAISDPNQKK